MKLLAALVGLLFAVVQSGIADESSIAAETNARILTNRTSTLRVQVLDQSGKPVPNAKVELEHIGHIFKFGAAYHRQFPVDRDPQNEVERKHRDAFLKLFNYATVTFYWGPYEPQQGKPEEARTVGAIDWMNQHGIVARGHPIFWNHRDIVPSWVAAQGTNYEALTALMDTRLAGLSKSVLPRMHDADVFNELVEWSRFTNVFRALAKDDLKEPVIHYLKETKRLNPGLKTVINDYVTDQRFSDLLGTLIERGAPIDIIGQQCHMHAGVWSPTKTQEILERLGKLNRPIVFSELSVLSGPIRENMDWYADAKDWSTDPEHEKTQAAYIEQFYSLIYSYPQSMGIVLWNFDDHGAWLGAPVGILRKDGSPKPSFEVLDELINHKWRTNGEFTTDENGVAVIPKAYEGHYKIKAGNATGAGDHTAAKPLQITLRTQ